jgi:hypothetical protein
MMSAMMRAYMVKALTRLISWKYSMLARSFE